jgi:tetratricopeptide (TPR) repeat protein
MFLGRHGRFKQAIDECDALRASTPPDQVVLAALKILSGGSEPTAPEFQRVESWINEAAARAGGKLDPRILRAPLLAIRGDVAAARALYEDIVKANPKDFTALNNLAWLLALTGNAQESAKALPLIDRAVEIIGPNPALLDTRAIVQLALHDYDKAENELKMALGSQLSPMYLYHLARVQLAKGNKPAAQETFRKAKDLGFSTQLLDPLERSIYERELGDLEAP